MRNYSRRGFGSANRNSDRYNDYEDDNYIGDGPYRERRYYGTDLDVNQWEQSSYDDDYDSGYDNQYFDSDYDNDDDDYSEGSQQYRTSNRNPGRHRGENLGGLSDRRGYGSSYSDRNRYNEERVGNERGYGYGYGQTAYNFEGNRYGGYEGRPRYANTRGRYDDNEYFGTGRSW